LATRPVVVLSRPAPEPPATLRDDEAACAVRREVIRSSAGRLIDTAAHPLLEQYCRCVVRARQLAAQVAGFDMAIIAEQPGAIGYLNRLHAMSDRATSRVASLAFKLRLAPSSRLHRATAGRLVEDATAGQQKPWEFLGTHEDERV